MYCHEGKIELIEATGLPLGLFDDAEYDEFIFQAEPGDMFVFFSDGILDATNQGRRSLWAHAAGKNHRRVLREFGRVAW